MKHFLTLFITALMAITAQGAANVGVGSMPAQAAMTNTHYAVTSTGNTSNSPIRLLQWSTISNMWIGNLPGRQLLANANTTGISKYATNQALDILYTNTTWVYPTDNIVTALSNAQNNTRVFIMPGNYQYTSRWIFSNSLGQAGINIFNKSNIVFEAAIPGSVRIYSTNIGDGLFITNSTRLAFRNINFEGWVVTNYASTTLYTEPGVVWGAFNIYDVADLEVSGCRFENFHDHVIQGTGANVNWNGASTNRIRIFNNYFANIGSARTNAGISIDGTAIVPDGPWEIFNNTFYGNLRDIEPYSDGDAAVRPWSGTHIYGNRFINTIDSSILAAGSTNANDVVIDGNIFIREVGWTRRGTNYISSAAAVDFSGGSGWRTINNTFIGEWTRGVYYWNGTRFGEIVNNSFVGITNSGSSTGVPIDAQVGYYHRIEGNKIRNSEGQGIYAYGLRDSIIKDNEVYDSAAEIGIQIATFGGQVSSNLTFSGNRLFGNNTGFWDQGLSGSLSLRFDGNEVLGNSGTAYDLASTSLANRDITTFDSSGGTNRAVRQFEVKDQINAGSNITLTTNSSGGITIAATGGSGSSNMVTAEIGRLNITNGISMTGAGSAGLDLVSGTSAKTFSISVPDALTASSTNKFDFNSPTAGQVIAVHSSSANVTVWTNATASGGGSNFVTSAHGSAHITNGLRLGSVTYSNDWQIAQEGSRIRRQATAKEGSTTIDSHGFASFIAAGTAQAFSASATNNSRVNTYSAASANADAGYEVNSAAVRPGFENRIHGVATIVSTTNQTRVWWALSSDTLSALTDRDMPSTKHVIGLRFNSETNSNWWFVSANGSSATNIDTGVAVRGGGYRARISLIENVTPTTTNWVAWINGIPVATNTALLPTQPMKWIGSIRTFDAAAKTNAFEYLEHTAAP